VASKNQKRAPGESPALSFILRGGRVLLAVFSAVVVLALLWLGWHTFRPDLFLDPIDRFIHVRYLTRSSDSWSEPAVAHVSMVPELFAVGEDGAEARRRIVAAGYHANGEAGGKLYFQKLGPVSAIICQSIYFVTLELDGQGTLAGVEAGTSYYCV
jgi:hypothetical protein